MSLNIVPTYDQPLNSKGQTNSVWYFFFQSLFKGVPPSNEVAITPGASPFPYTATQKGFMIVRGGTVSAIQFTRSATNLTGQTAGIFPLNQGDALTITYSALPTLVWVPT